MSIGGATYMVHVVDASDLSLDLAVDAGNLVASGKLQWRGPGTITPPTPASSSPSTIATIRVVTTRLVETGADGSFQDRFCPPAKGTWHAVAFWQGDLKHSAATSDEKQIDIAADCLPGQATPTPRPGGDPDPRPATPTFQTAPATSTPTRTPQPGPFIGSFTANPNCQINTVSINWRVDNPTPNTTIEITRNGQFIHSSNSPQGGFVDQIPKGTFTYTLTVPGVDFRSVSISC